MRLLDDLTTPDDHVQYVLPERTQASCTNARAPPPARVSRSASQEGMARASVRLRLGERGGRDGVAPTPASVMSRTGGEPSWPRSCPRNDP